MPAHVKRAGVWRELDAVHVKAGGAWREVDALWVKRGGVWREVFTGAFQFTQTISTNTNQYNLSTELTNAGWNGSSPVIATITVATSVTVYSTSTAVPAWDMGGALPAKSSVTLINNGNIYGMGGAGGDGGDTEADHNPGTNNWSRFGLTYASNSSNMNGRNGGTALKADGTISVWNNGQLKGGGGGGGGGHGVIGRVDACGVQGASTGGPGGGGGAGAPNTVAAGGDGGLANGLAWDDPSGMPPRTQGAVGSASSGITPGTGGPSQDCVPFSSTGTSGAGGAGGNLGTSGSDGGSATKPGGVWTLSDSPGTGGLAGCYVDGYSFVTWSPEGVVAGRTTG